MSSADAKRYESFLGFYERLCRVESVSPRAVKVRLANGETVSASKLTVGDQNLADLIGLIPNNFNAQQATGLLEVYTPEVSAQVAPADYARAYNLAYQAGVQGFRESSINGINKAIPEITLQTAYVQGTVARQQSDKSTTRQAELNAQDAIEIDVDPEIDSYISNNNGSIIKGLKQYILALLDNEKITMSDGTVVSVDSADAKHIAKRASHSDRQRAEISNLKKLIKKAELYNSAKSTKNDKFSFYKYYEAKAKYKGETVFVTLNVGQTKNDGTFRLYDITEPNERNKRNTPSRMNGSTGLSENPESIPFRKGASVNIISNRSGIVNPSDLTTRQRSAQEVASKAGFKVVFEDIPENGFFDPKTRTVHISVNDPNPVHTTLMHELAHYAELSESYWTNFANPILESKSFLNWIKGKGFASVPEYKQALIKEYADQGHPLTEVRNSDGTINNMAAEQEMVAKFTGEVLFANNTTGLQRFLQQMTAKERRGFVTHIRAFFNWIKNRMANIAGRFNEKVAAQNAIRALEKRFTDTLKRVENGATSESKSGKRYAVFDEMNLDTNTELHRLVENLKGTARQNVIRNYILNVLADQPITLSDGRIAIVDGGDAKHMAHAAWDKKTAEIAQIKKIVESAKLVAYDDHAQHNKFTEFYYYEMPVRFGDERFNVYVNVGFSPNDQSNHIYDFTQTLRDTVRQIDGAESEKSGGRLRNGISNSSISASAESVNTKFSQTDIDRFIRERIEASRKADYRENADAYRIWTDFYKQFQRGKADENNYYYNTMATFEPVKRRPSGTPDYVSYNRDGKVSSEYWYTDDGVIRGSNHWGWSVASCDWFYGDQYSQQASNTGNKQYGYCPWDGFVFKTLNQKTENHGEILRTFENSPEKVTVVAVVSDKHLDLFTQTMYAQKRRACPHRQM